ncbi:tryptophan synthase subunit alpha [Thalassotalea agarivorans]|uniref:Tryptophan synthase alpha chain n=1 Tax=Thalassotalea agarivorans TaxID=349064 RepID=A0A1I0EN50_THASX|nr:tryptophan synthase subunit alpha [Thalassotalea agarivorans]SET46398.1 tryptophan synthase, alpha chain [Thalassotalea agarivorans]
MAQQNRYEKMFNAVEARMETGAFVPFVTIGDPSPALSFEIIKTLIDNGADGLELGIPFSDPSADGIVIQKAGIRALSAGVNTDGCFDILKQVRGYAPDVPIGLLLYGNLVFAYGIDRFYQQLASIGVDSILIADLPIRESQPFREAAEKHGIAQIFIAPPNANEKTLSDIAQFSKGYTYVLSRAGVTGTHSDAQVPKLELIDKLQALNAPPAVIGFGISTPEHVKAALDSGARGAISGSATVKLIEEHLDSPEQMLAALASFVSGMKAATKA